MALAKRPQAPSEPIMEQNGNKIPQYIAALSVCLGAVAAGCVFGWTSNISQELKDGGLNEIHVDDDAMGWIGSCATLGAMVACFPIGIVCDWIGRKLAMLLLLVPFIAGWLLIIFANGTAMLFAGRFISGLAGGAFCVSAPMYTSEIAEKEVRGALGSYFQLLLTAGILFAYVVAYFTRPMPYTIVCGVVPLVFGVAFLLQPETPVYLVRRGRREEARNALRRLRGTKYNVDRELREIETATQMETISNAMSWSDSLRKRATRLSSLIVFGLMLFQQLSGVNAVIFYTGDIFLSSGAELDPKIATIIVGAMQVAATFAASLFVDKLGRKLLLITSAIFMGISIILLAVFFTLKERKLVDDATISTLGFLPVLALCIFMIAFSVGFGPIPWMMSAELFPPEVKTVGSAAAGTFNWFVAFLVTKFYLDIKTAVGGDVIFYVFGVISLLSAVFIVCITPETKGKTLQEIQQELNGEKIIPGGIENEAYSHK